MSDVISLDMLSVWLTKTARHLTEDIAYLIIEHDIQNTYLLA